jgi:carbonic anhydrase
MPSAGAGARTSPARAWAELERGNAHFVAGDPPTGDTSAQRRAETTHAQEPFALVFGCSDSRVSAELVFDQGLGDLFVVRTAGHVTDAGVLGSIEFGVGVLGIPLVVVLGHHSCGAISATLDVLDGAEVPQGYVRDVVERVTPSVLSARRLHGGGATREQVLVEHVRQSVDQLARRSVVVAEAVAEGRCALMGVVYDLADGQARVVEVVGELA